jgi:hypothetical protein
MTPETTSAASAAESLRNLINDPATPEVIRLGLIAMLRGMATKVAEVVTDKPGRERKTVSKEQTLEHLARWIATAERERVRPTPGVLPPFTREK